ncbi:uncharacterized protein B0I36DRAFT_323495 [Microdochium trichocladiopsis]|uniref:Uncharacterized protein n=1 Tax=Microdochium trichocladiopsis TaxID=1682393 RepID=A0A9P8Y9H3_9PEZI|nr:uncharacterized protein B0I36DRAFT_323495 [Microdochium trichocladiopsis]KAH7031244.1 hypothetical protein B0I36DRAFT_323495 [Microdochium trichocladiopsis]
MTAILQPSAGMNMERNVSQISLTAQQRQARSPSDGKATLPSQAMTHAQHETRVPQSLESSTKSEQKRKRSGSDNTTSNKLIAVLETRQTTIDSLSAVLVTNMSNVEEASVHSRDNTKLQSYTLSDTAVDNCADEALEVTADARQSVRSEDRRSPVDQQPGHSSLQASFTNGNIKTAGLGHKLFLSSQKVFQAKFRDLVPSVPKSSNWAPGDGFAATEAVPDFTFFTTGRHKRRCTRPAPSFGRLELAQSEEFGSGTQRAPLRPKIQRLTQHQLKLRRGPAIDFWPTQHDFADDSAVFSQRLPRVTKTKSSLGEIKELAPELFVPRSGHREACSDVMDPLDFRYVSPPAFHGAVDFENFRRLHTPPEKGHARIPRALFGICAWRVDASSESASDGESTMEIEFLPSSIGESSNECEDDESAILGDRAEMESNSMEEESIASEEPFTSDSYASSILGHDRDGRELGLLGSLDHTATNVNQEGECKDLGDTVAAGQDFLKMIQARRAVSCGSPLQHKMKRWHSDRLGLEEKSSTHCAMAHVPRLSRQYTT